MGCIYEIYCPITNKRYIGQTTDYKRRCNFHKLHLKRGDHTNSSLQIDFNMYDESNFIYNILEDNIEINNLNSKEDFWMNYYGGFNSSNLYNEKDNTDMSAICQKKIAIGHKNEIPWDKDKRMTEEFRRNQSLRNKGKNNPMYGKSSKKKYDELFVKELREEYSKIGNIAEIARRRKINEGTVRNLINHGKSYNPNSSFYKRKYNRKEVKI